MAGQEPYVMSWDDWGDILRHQMTISFAGATAFDTVIETEFDYPPME
jgi:hypothetical protein